METENKKEIYSNLPVMRSLPCGGDRWLQKEIDKRQRAIHEWIRISARTNICDNLGGNPIDKLDREIKMIKEIMCALAEGNDA